MLSLRHAFAHTLPMGTCGLSSDPPPARSQEARKPFSWVCTAVTYHFGEQQGGHGEGREGRLGNLGAEAWRGTGPGPGSFLSEGGNENNGSEGGLVGVQMSSLTINSRRNLGRFQVKIDLSYSQSRKLHLDPRPSGAVFTVSSLWS